MGKKINLDAYKENTPAEDAAIRSAIRGDANTWEASRIPEVKPRGRPRGSNKSQVTIKLDNEVLAALKTPEAKGWQTRANALLRRALNI